MNLRLLQLGDSALPIGGYSHSWGLEAAIERGLARDAPSLESWTRHYLREMLGPLEGIIVGAVVRSRDCAADANRLLWASLTPPTLRNASRDMGEQLLSLAATWDWAAAFLPSHSVITGSRAGNFLPSPPVFTGSGAGTFLPSPPVLRGRGAGGEGVELAESSLTTLRSETQPIASPAVAHAAPSPPSPLPLSTGGEGGNSTWHHAVVFGCLAAGAGASARDAVALYLHQAALGVISAGVRGIPIGHTHGQQILARLHEDIAELAARYYDKPLETAGSNCPAYEILCHEQSRLYTRIFRS